MTILWREPQKNWGSGLATVDMHSSKEEQKPDLWGFWRKAQWNPVEK